MNYRTHFKVKNLFRYWRNTLADEDLTSLDGTACPVCTKAGVVNSGALDKDSVKKLQQAWRAYEKQASWNQTIVDLATQRNEAIPIIILGKGYAPKHEHGKLIGDKDSYSAHYTLHIPATLSPSGALSAVENSIPWIGREYLLPNNEADKNIPIIGDLAAYDNWLNKNPLGEGPWEEYMRWCDELCGQVIGDRVPSGFVPLPDIRIDISKSVRNAGRHICQLYDALRSEQHLPSLLVNMCGGSNEHIDVSADFRIRQLASHRGTMSTAYGLADSQADAMAAYTAMEIGDVLAVNGPPGTGKTTLLQSIIATEVVARAIAGGEPAVIVGSSMNNQPILNINKSLNKIFQENPALSLFPWARRWIPNADTYGLYLPASEDKANDAERKGYAIAMKNGMQWNGFPEREASPEYLAQAKTMWFEGYSESYGTAPESVEEGLKRFHRDLSDILDEVNNIQDSFEHYRSIAQWWRTTAGKLTPEAYLKKEDASFSSAINLAIKDLQDTENVVEKVKALRDSARVKADEMKHEAEHAYDEQQAYMRKLVWVKAKVNAAVAPHGFLEAFAEMFRIFRGVFNRRRLSRLCILVAEERMIGELFEKQIQDNNPAAWICHVDNIIKEAASETARLRNDQSVEAERSRKEVAEFDRQWAAAVSTNDLAVRKVEKARHHRNTQLEALREKIQELDNQTKGLQEAHSTLRCCAVSEFSVESAQIEVPDRIPTVQDFDWLLDITWRHMAFQKAMRYWEGRWILEAEAVQENKVNTKSGRTGMEARFRRWCMLTPCLVVTAHSLPKHFRFTSNIGGDNPWVSNFMLGFIDLLVMDEAGQVGSHVGAAAFALASRAVVVGDIYQIEPVNKISRGTDYANSTRAGLRSLWKEGDPASPHLVSEPSDGTPMGSVMRLAQSATVAVSPGTEGEPGIFLTEHRRCRSEIVAYCNKLIYQGRLKPMSPPRSKDPPLPPIAWAHVRGEARKVGGSRANSPEAESIAGWIANNTELWCQHYGKPIDEIVAVVTPFRPQSRLIKEALDRKGQRYSKVTIGTVHSLQGAERPIVIFSPTYNADTVKGMFFDRKPNMLNVAVSRAEDSFVVIGDMRLFRRKGHSPSAILGEVLFADERNELIDVDGNHRFSRQLLVQAERISSLERHREVLRNSLRQCCRGQVVLIASPWITTKAINDDGLAALITNAVKERGGKVWIVVDRELCTRFPRHNGAEAIKILKKAGAIISKVTKMHNKTLIYNSSEIIEGSFNWLSAQRKRGDKFIRHEVSWRITGKNAAVAIQSAMEEFSKLGAGVNILNQQRQIALADMNA